MSYGMRQSPERLCPDDPGRACGECLERWSSDMAQSRHTTIRSLNDYASGYSPVTTTSRRVRDCAQCVIL